MICTPNGRFAINQKLCLTMSDFHPESWNPMWNVSTILTGLHNFFHEDSMTVGSIRTSVSSKRTFASESMEFNLKNKHFVNLFGDLIEIIREEKEKAQHENIKNNNLNDDKAKENNKNLGNGNNDLINTRNSQQKKNVDKQKDWYGLGYALIALAISGLVLALVMKASTI